MRVDELIAVLEAGLPRPRLRAGSYHQRVFHGQWQFGHDGDGVDHVQATETLLGFELATFVILWLERERFAALPDDFRQWFLECLPAALFLRSFTGDYRRRLPRGVPFEGEVRLVELLPSRARFEWDFGARAHSGSGVMVFVEELWSG